jgi:hypothetical protein
MTLIVLVFALPMFLAGAMISPEGLHFSGLLALTSIVLVGMPFFAWPSFAQAALFPTAGESRTKSVVGFWIGGGLVVVAGLYFVISTVGYPPPVAIIDQSGHLLVPFAPRAGLAIGLFALCQLVACGVWGVLSPVLRVRTALFGAALTGCTLFVIVYGCGWLLVHN